MGREEGLSRSLRGVVGVDLAVALEPGEGHAEIAAHAVEIGHGEAPALFLHGLEVARELGEFPGLVRIVFEKPMEDFFEFHGAERGDLQRLDGILGGQGRG